MSEQPTIPSADVDLDALPDEQAVALLNETLADPEQQAPDPEPVHQTPELDILHPAEQEA